MGVYFKFWGMSLAIEMEDEGKLSVLAENQGVVKGEAGEGSDRSDATKLQSKYTNIRTRDRQRFVTWLRFSSVFSGKNPRALKTEGATIV